MTTLLAKVIETGNASYMYAAKDKYEEVIEVVRSCNAELVTFESITLEVKIKKHIFHNFKELLKPTGITIHDVKYTGIDKMKFELKGFQKGCSVQINKDLEGAKKVLDDFIKKFITSVGQNRIKILSFEPTYLVDTPVSHATCNQEDINGNKGKVHSEEWNKKIGDGHRGQKYKTKALEGITWERKGNKKVWLMAA